MPLYILTDEEIGEIRDCERKVLREASLFLYKKLRRLGHEQINSGRAKAFPSCESAGETYLGEDLQPPISFHLSNHRLYGIARLSFLPMAVTFRLGPAIHTLNAS
ncbi:hypothetical protein SAMN05216420_10816 [Nitrosospira sp. Nl5]|nr:hypothetical protein SAMN05216420_10816 [Nitrosospira sp. Nl5]